MNVRYGSKTYTFHCPMTVRKLLKKLRVVPEGVIVAVNGNLVTSDHRIMLEDDVEIVRAISGGSKKQPAALFDCGTRPSLGNLSLDIRRDGGPDA